MSADPLDEKLHRLCAAIGLAHGQVVAHGVEEWLLEMRGGLGEIEAAVLDTVIHDFTRAVEELGEGATPAEIGALANVLAGKRD